MYLKKLLIIFTYLLVATGLLIIYFSEEISNIHWIIIVGVFILSIFFQPDWSKRYITHIWNTGLITTLFIFIFKGISEGNWLILVLYFSIIMVLSKLFQRRNYNDYYQVYVLSFLQIIAGAVVNPGLSFGVLFLFYVIFLTCCLLLVNIYKNLSYEIGLSKIKGLVSKKLLVSVSILATGIFLLSLILFFFFPRLGLGFFKLNLREGLAIGGFSTNVELGKFAQIKNDTSVVMRIIIDKGKRIKGDVLRMRGISLDFYDGKGWEKTHKKRISLRVDLEGYYRTPPYHRHTLLEKKNLIEQEVYLEPIESELKPVFGLVGIVAIDKRSGVMEMYPEGKFGVYRDFIGDLTFIGPSGRGIFYRVFSDKEQKGILKETISEDLINEYYLQLPEIKGEIKSLGEKITQGEEDPLKKAHLVSLFLQKNYEYSLTQFESKDDPVRDFLFKNKKGHCEYFASAMVIILRSIGIPSRIVNGFYGGKWNEFGNYYAITGADAHSWVEVYNNGEWKTYDPTPPSFFDLKKDKGIILKLSEYLDSLKLKWYRWVIEYDLEKQLYIISGIFNYLRGKTAEREDFLNLVTISQIKRMKNEIKRLPFMKIFLSIFLIIFLIFLLKYLFKRLKDRKKKIIKTYNNKIVKIYIKLLKKLSSKGIKKQPSTTPDELMLIAEKEKHEDYEKIKKIINYYQEAIFSKSPDIPDLLNRMKSIYNNIK